MNTPPPEDQPPPDDHTTPHPDALTLTERALLGACLTDPRAIDDTADTGLLPTHCYQARHELILAATYAVHATGTRPDPITVADHLTTTGDLTRAGGLTYLHELTLDVAATTNAAWYATKIRHAHTHRTIRTTGTTLAATPEHDDPLDSLEHARATLDALAIEDDTTPTHETAIYDAIAALDQPPGTPTPWAPLTRLIAGWKPGELYIIGARPGIGKTVIGGAILLDAARRHQPTTYISLEMTRTELYHRLLANTGNVDMGRIQHRNLTDTDHHHLATAAADLARLPLHIDDRSALSLAQVRATLRTRARRQDEPLGPVVIDYLGLLTPPSGAPRNDRRVQVDAISRGLKNLAKDLNIPVIALAQLNRASEMRADKTPTLSDLREAGGQEQDADVVILLHRDLTAKGDPTDMRVIVGKNRHGALGQLHLHFDGPHSRATEPRWTPTSALERNPA